MNSQQSKTKIIKFVLIFLVASLCFWIAFIPCPILPNSKANRPIYLDQVWPAENMSISIGCYCRRTLNAYLFNFPTPSNIGNPPKDLKPGGGVAVTIFPNTLIDEQVRDNPSFPSRVFLYIDDRRISQTAIDRGEPDFNGYFDDYTPQFYYFGGYPILFPGEHIARFVIMKIDGTNLEYEWHFTITWW